MCFKYKFELILFSIILIVFILLISFFYMDKVQNSFKSIKAKEKILTMEYKEIMEFNDPYDEKITVQSHVTYVYPDKLRIDRSGNTKTVEIYNGKRYVYYDIISRKLMHETTSIRRAPDAVKKGKKLVEIIKSGAYEFFGYEEKDNKKLKVIGVITETEGHMIMHKYWIEVLKGINLPYKEEYFIDNCVVSKTTYIYLKLNQAVNYDTFNISTLKSNF